MSENDDNDDDNDDESVDPLDRLAEMGFHGGEAVDALMQANGNLEQAVVLLSSNHHGKAKNNSTNKQSSKGKKEKKGKKKKQNDNANTEETTTTPVSFKEQRKNELRFKKALRDRKHTCRVCGGPHPRKQCPGIADDGRGHSRYHDKNARKEHTKQRKEFLQQVEQDKAFLEIGKWTKTIPYMDGFANLAEIESWDNTRTVSLGENNIGIPSQEQHRQELKTWSGTKLRENAFSMLKQAGKDEETLVNRALEAKNPRTALIDIILVEEKEALERARASSHEVAYRSVQSEWPGYRGCLCPLSLLDTTMQTSGGGGGVLERLYQNQAKENHGGVNILLSIPPADVAKWLVVDNEFEQNTSTPLPPLPIDLTFLVRQANQMKSIQLEMKQTASESLEKQGRSSAEAEVARLRKLLAALKSRKVTSQEVIEGAAERAYLSPQVGEMLDEMMNDNIEQQQKHRKVVGISCGLNYTTTEAQHALLGPVVREAQRQACQLAVQVAVKASLPIVLECHDESSLEPTIMEKASSDLVKILATHAPPETTLLLRTGSLTTEFKPGLPRLFQTWPNLFVGLSAKVAYSKCPKVLLDVAFDLPLERLILTSESPNFLPPSLNGATHLVSMCLPPHVACVADSIASIKKGSITRESVLNGSTRNLCRAFRLAIQDDEPVTASKYEE